MNNTHRLRRLTMKVLIFFLSTMLLFAQVASASPPAPGSGHRQAAHPAYKPGPKNRPVAPPAYKPGPRNRPGAPPAFNPGYGHRPMAPPAFDPGYGHRPMAPPAFNPGYGHRRPGPPIRHGRVFPILPLGYAALMVAGSLFYYNAGSYYRQAPSGYVVVSTPVGAVIPSIPANCPYVVINGITYFTYGGAYYRQVGNGYEVVADPTQNTGVQSLVPIGRVKVIAKALNVRSGPGVENSVVYIVHSGNILHIIGSAPGWHYVQLPNGSFGWVMEKFTAPLVQPAEG